MKRQSFLRPLALIPAIATITIAVLVGCTVVQGAKTKQSSSYDPMALPSDSASSFLELSVSDQSRSRDIPIKVYLPSGKVPAPVVLFSHGLGGSREGSAFLGQHWAGRGYVAVFLQHPGSDDSVWKNVPKLQRMAALRQAASLENFLLRVQDVPAVLNQLERWNRSDRNPLSGRLNLAKIGMSGHSFGAVTTQSVSGQSFPDQGQSFTDSRIRAALILSPSTPRKGDPAVAFGSVTIPWMLMTGTEDKSPLGNVDASSRLNVFPNLPPGDKYELVLENAEHSIFTENRIPGDRQPRNPNHHRAIAAISTAFWDTYLRDDPAARIWLKGKEARSVLESGDRWQLK